MPYHAPDCKCGVDKNGAGLDSAPWVNNAAVTGRLCLND